MDSEFNKELDWVIFNESCPECTTRNLYFLPYYPGETFEVECDTCGWEGCFTEEELENAKKYVPIFFWKRVYNWHD